MDGEPHRHVASATGGVTTARLGTRPGHVTHTVEHCVCGARRSALHVVTGVNYPDEPLDVETSHGVWWESAR